MRFTEICTRVRFYTMIINSIQGWNDIKDEASRRYSDLLKRLTPEMRCKIFEWNESRFKDRNAKWV